MKQPILLLLAVLLSSGLLQAQNKKSKASSAPAKKLQAAPAKDQKSSAADPAFNSLSNQIEGEAGKKLPPYRPALLADSLAKFIPISDEGTGALGSPFIIVAPAASDADNYKQFLKMAEELTQVKGVRNIVVKNQKEEVLAIAINNPSFLSLLNQRKNYQLIKTYSFSSLKALEGSLDPWIQSMNQQKSLAKEILLQNTDYLPKSAEIKGIDD